MKESLKPWEQSALHDLRQALAHWPRSLTLRVGGVETVNPAGVPVLRHAVFAVVKDGEEVARLSIGQEPPP